MASKYKSKEFISSDEDDSARDREYEPADETQTSRNSGGSSSSSSGSGSSAKSAGQLPEKVDGGFVFNLTSKRRITVRKFAGKPLVDIREFYDADGELKPGKKGISLTMDQFDAVVGMADTIRQAVKKL